MIDLTVVIPVSLVAGKEYLLERVVTLALFFLEKHVAVIIAEQNSESELLLRLIDEIPAGAKILSSVACAAFSLAQVRNSVFSEVKTEWLIFVDADLIFKANFVERLADVVRRPFMDSETAFLTLPVVYLAENAAPACALGIPLTQIRSVGDNAVLFVALASSVVLVRCAHFRAVGMYCEEFLGWGFEDHDLAMRLVAADGMFLPVRKPRFFDPRPMQELFQYIGWRSAYRLYGELAAANDLYAFHVWHSVTGNFRYAPSVKRNERIFLKRSRAVKFRKGYTPSIGLDSSLYDPYRMSLDVDRYGYLLSLLRARFLANKKLVNFYRRLRNLHVN